MALDPRWWEKNKWRFDPRYKEEQPPEWQSSIVPWDRGKWKEDKWEDWRYPPKGHRAAYHRWPGSEYDLSPHREIQLPDVGSQPGRKYKRSSAYRMGGGPSDLAESKAAAVPDKGFLGRGLNSKAFWEAMAEQEPYVDQTTAPPGGFVGESRVQGPVGTGKITPYGVAGGAESLAEYIKRIKKEGGLMA